MAIESFDSVTGSFDYEDHLVERTRGLNATLKELRHRYTILVGTSSAPQTIQENLGRQAGLFGQLHEIENITKEANLHARLRDYREKMETRT